MNSAQQPLHISQLAEEIQSVLDDKFAGMLFWVVGEIADLRHIRERNYYFFDLVEKDPRGNRLVAKISAHAFSSVVSSIRDFEHETGQAFESDLEVLVLVAVSYHPLYGLSLNMKDISVAYTLGKLARQRLLVMEELVKRNPGYVHWVAGKLRTRNQELKLPQVLQRLAIIGSQHSAGYGDFMHTLESNEWGLKFSVTPFFTEMQGVANAENLVNKLIEIFDRKADFDAVVITRGGGASTDFMLFNQYNVSRAIARFPIPILTGIGHQRDETIADLCSHTSLKTPTQVAEFIIDRNLSFETEMIDLMQKGISRAQRRIVANAETLQSYQEMIYDRGKRLLKRASSRLENIKIQLVGETRSRLVMHNSQLKTFPDRLKSSSYNILRWRHEQLQHYASALRLTDPELILKRGFVIVKREGEWIFDPEMLNKGDKVELQFAKSIKKAEILDQTEQKQK